MSFPIFTAGCEVHDLQVREKYRRRMNGMRRFGAGQINRAAELMEKSWEKNRPWNEVMDELGWEIVLA
jgi:hypothetical protein